MCNDLSHICHNIRLRDVEGKGLGGVFAVALNLLKIASPADFVHNPAPHSPLICQCPLYDSYVTLSTLGYVLRLRGAKRAGWSDS